MRLAASVRVRVVGQLERTTRVGQHRGSAVLLRYMTDSDVDAPLVLRNPAAPTAEDAAARREAPPYRVGVDTPARMYTVCGASAIAAKPVRVLLGLDAFERFKGFPAVYEDRPNA
jgi:hypothetical protein